MTPLFYRAWATLLCVSIQRMLWSLVTKLIGTRSRGCKRVLSHSHLFQKYFASIRLAFALVCVGASLLMAAQWFGFIPDAERLEMRARRDLCETIAITSSDQIRRSHWVDLQRTLQGIVDHHPGLLSIGVRSNLGTLRVDTGHHREIWPESFSADSPQLPSPEVASETIRNTPGVETAFVPIEVNRRLWGRVEYCFHRPIDSALGQTLSQPLIQLVGFFLVSGLFSYTLFVARMLGVFSSTQVVPDRVRQALDTLAEGLLVLDEKGKIVLANRAFAGIVELPTDRLESRLADDLNWVREDLTANGASPWSLAINQSTLQTECMIRFKLVSGKQRIFSVNAAPLGKEGASRGALATFRDVTHVEEHRIELERMLKLLKDSRDEINHKNQELEILATRDSLTGCLNRRAFFERFAGIWDSAQADAGFLSCIMIDVDHFKSVNDTYGHHTGDEVLKAVSAVVRELFVDFGLVCRYGGEEFCVLLPGYDAEKAMMQSEKIRHAISQIRLENPEELRLTTSLGVSELRFAAKNPQDLINQADACLYVAKRNGRNQSVLFNASMIVSEEQESSKEDADISRVEIPYKAVTALMSALSFRDSKTAEHCRRVSNLCARAAEDLLSVNERYVLEVAGLLHDIGKIGVPDHILFKPGKLTDKEWEIMGRHDHIGVEIVDGAFDCPELSRIVANHHAFFDGGGRETDVPTGHDIPLPARLLSIADSYDAMVSDRPYRKGCSHTEAIQELRSCAGTQFDPDLVEHFIDKINAATPEYATGAHELSKYASIAIGGHVEELVYAIDAGDLDQVRQLCDHITAMADSIGLHEIGQAAREITKQDTSGDRSDADQETRLLRQARDLIDRCRSTQSHFLHMDLQKQCESSAAK